MGMANAWGGSGGRDWAQVRRDVADLVTSPSDDAVREVVDGLLDAIDWDDPASDTGEGTETLPAGEIPAKPRLRPAPGGGGGAGSGGGGLVFRRPSSPASGGKGGSRRSRSGASRAAGSVLAAGLALRRGDAETLARLGLDLGELQGLGPLQQGQSILNVLIGSGAAIEEAELRQANSPALRRILMDELEGTEAIRVFLVEYAMQIFDSEVGEAAREGADGSTDALRAEREVRSAVSMRVEQVDLSADAVSPEQLAAAINTALETMRKVRPE